VLCERRGAKERRRRRRRRRKKIDRERESMHKSKCIILAFPPPILPYLLILEV
jgi:hypothetical protein